MSSIMTRPSIEIGELKLNGYVYIPPMAGYTDYVYREICREFDPDVLMSTEMLSSKAMVHASKHKVTHSHFQRMEIPKGDAYTGVQLFGHEPEIMAKAARIAIDTGAKFIDINMGCPVPKIVKGMDGAALMREPDLACEIVAAVMKVTDLPVTVKTRLGWCSQSINSPELCKRFEDLGVKALTIHGRTRAQKYEGSANWELIGKVVNSVSIPVFANGDINSLEDVKKIMSISGAKGVAIARGTMGRPWFSRQVNHFIKTGEDLAEPSWEERLRLTLKHTKMLVDYKGERVGIKEARKHIMNYTSGIHGASHLRKNISKVETYTDAESMVSEIAKVNNLSL